MISCRLCDISTIDNNTDCIRFVFPQMVVENLKSHQPYTIAQSGILHWLNEYYDAASNPDTGHIHNIVYFFEDNMYAPNEIYENNSQVEAWFTLHGVSIFHDALKELFDYMQKEHNISPIVLRQSVLTEQCEIVYADEMQYIIRSKSYNTNNF